MSQVQRLKASKPCPAYKVRRLRRDLISRVRQEAEFQHDCTVAYAAMVQRVVAHNVATSAYAPRASPAVH